MSDGRNELFDKTMDEISAPDVLDSSPQHPFVFDGLEEGEQLLEMARQHEIRDLNGQRMAKDRSLKQGAQCLRPETAK
jgi:hypothetical protein